MQHQIPVLLQCKVRNEIVQQVDKVSDFNTKYGIMIRVFTSGRDSSNFYIFFF